MPPVRHCRRCSAKSRKLVPMKGHSCPFREARRKATLPHSDSSDSEAAREDPTPPFPTPTPTQTVEKSWAAKLDEAFDRLEARAPLEVSRLQAQVEQLSAERSSLLTKSATTEGTLKTRIQELESELAQAPKRASTALPAQPAASFGMGQTTLSIYDCLATAVHRALEAKSLQVQARGQGGPTTFLFKSQAQAATSGGRAQKAGRDGWQAIPSHLFDLAPNAYGSTRIVDLLSMVYEGKHASVEFLMGTIGDAQRYRVEKASRHFLVLAASQGALAASQGAQDEVVLLQTHLETRATRFIRCVQGGASSALVAHGPPQTLKPAWCLRLLLDHALPLPGFLRALKYTDFDFAEENHTEAGASALAALGTLWASFAEGYTYSPSDSRFWVRPRALRQWIEWAKSGLFTTVRVVAHGCSPRSYESIVANPIGFDPFTNSHAYSQHYGYGTYFSLTTHIAAEYTRLRAVGDSVHYEPGQMVLGLLLCQDDTLPACADVPASSVGSWPIPYYTYDYMTAIVDRGYESGREEGARWNNAIVVREGSLLLPLGALIPESRK